MTLSELGTGASLTGMFGLSELQAPDAGLLARNIMNQRDRNRDAVLNETEAQTLPFVFDGADMNGDGVVELEELISKITSAMTEAGLISDNVGS